MKNVFRYIIFGVLGILLVGIMIGIYLYNKPHQNIEDQTPDYIVDAQGLMKAYRLDETLANEKYLGKILMVTGEVMTIDSSMDGSISYSLEDALFGITCTINGEDSKELLKNRKKIEKGDQVTLKGRCDGVLTDVRISDCVLIE